MDLGRLGKKARNELMRNPKKSAILGVICLVALYFWLPLLRGWVSGGAKKVAKASPPTAVVATAPTKPEPTSTAETSKSTARAEAAYRWDKLIRQRKQDPLMSPAVIDAASRNPFRQSDDLRRELAAVRETEVNESSPVVDTQPAVAIAPQDLGLVLKGTLVGSRSKSATINTRTYREGAQVVVSAAPQGNGQNGVVAERAIEFTLAAVRKDSVVLTRGDKSFTLEFRKVALSPALEIAKEMTTPEQDAVSGGDEE